MNTSEGCSDIYDWRFLVNYNIRYVMLVYRNKKYFLIDIYQLIKINLKQILYNYPCQFYKDC